MNRRIRPLICALVTAASLGGCVMNQTDTEPQTIVLRDDAGSPLRVEIDPGAQWSSRMQAGPFVFNVLPQFAVWTEDEAGDLVETLYVTGADFRGMRHAQKNEMQGEYFRKCLPVWAMRVTESGVSLPSKADPYSDAVTSATPAGQATLVTSIDHSTGAAHTRYLIQWTRSRLSLVGRASATISPSAPPGQTHPQKILPTITELAKSSPNSSRLPVTIPSDAPIAETTGEK